MAEAKTSTNTEILKVNEKKWTKPVMSAGWSAFPNIIIERQRALGLEPLDINIILHLTQYWWTADNLPHPSVATIATAIGVTPRTIQKRIAALEKAGLMKREERRNTPRGSITNLYSFDGLIQAVTPFAKEKVEESKAKAEATKQRLARKKPKLVVNNDE
ncbi:helix-turn-helix domain-containing protein (plasmid) [Rhizobium leguminosarum]